MIESGTIPQTITTIPELTSALAESERTTFGKILRSLDLPLDELRAKGTWSQDHYTRNCIFENENFELILLCWEAGQATPVHDHGGEECFNQAIAVAHLNTIDEMNLLNWANN